MLLLDEREVTVPTRAIASDFCKEGGVYNDNEWTEQELQENDCNSTVVCE